MCLISGDHVAISVALVSQRSVEPTTCLSRYFPIYWSTLNCHSCPTPSIFVIHSECSLFFLYPTLASPNCTYSISGVDDIQVCYISTPINLTFQNMIIQDTYALRGPIPDAHAHTPHQTPSEDAILRISAYHRIDFGRTVIWFSPGTHMDMLASTSSISDKPIAALGNIDRLPLELIHNILLELDIASLFRLRQTNIRARQILNALHEYRTIIAHAINPLCALLRTGSASNVKLIEFYRLLCTQSCSLCGNEYGDLVYLLKWVRCCSGCLTQKSSGIRVTTFNSVKRILKLSKKSLEKLEKLKTLSGIYTMDQCPRSSRMTVVSMASALSAYREEHAGVEASQLMIAQLSTQPILNFMACCVLPSFDVQTGKAEYGVSCAGCQLALQEDILTSIGGCWYKKREVVYSQKGFLEHFKCCEPAQDLWTASYQGTRQAPDLPYLCQTGGLFDCRK